MYEIKRGTPAMARKTNTKYPFHLLEKKSFFEIPAADPGAKLNKNLAPKVGGSAYSYAKRHGLTFAVRRLDNGNIRVFRTE
jgi:hypothetical protein